MADGTALPFSDTLSMPNLELPNVTLDAFGEPELDDLDQRTAHILRMCTGMVDGEKHTCREIGDELGLGTSRVSQLQREGLMLIRQLREIQRHLRNPPLYGTYPWARLRR